MLISPSAGAAAATRIINEVREPHVEWECRRPPTKRLTLGQAARLSVRVMPGCCANAVGETRARQTTNAADANANGLVDQIEKQAAKLYVAELLFGTGNF